MENIAPRFIKGEEKMRKKMLCYGMALCFMILPGSQRVSAAENLENACIWLKDEGYSFTPDLDAAVFCLIIISRESILPVLKRGVRCLSAHRKASSIWQTL